VVHRTAGKVVSRQTRGIMAQVQAFAEEATRAVELLVHLAEEHEHMHETISELAGHVEAAVERVARIDRARLDSPASLADLRRRVEALEAVEARQGFRPWFSGERFEERFRGSRPELLDRYRDLAARLQGCGPVLDIGFGRAELLELLGELGVEARGVEIDGALVAAARARGFDVAAGTATDTLLAEDDGALGGIALIQVVEHLAAQELLEVVLLARDKLRPGGKLIMETVNPGSLYVFAHSFYIDPTHTRPIHHAYLDFLCREAGFTTVETEWRSNPPDQDRLQPADGRPDLDGNLARLNGLLWSAGDYAVVATR
jgi:O-antigen chain-terminating methyltransferase